MNRLICATLLALLSASPAFSQYINRPTLKNNPPGQQIMIPYRKAAKWGYCDTLGKVLVAPQFDSTGFFQLDMERKTALAVFVQKGMAGMLSPDLKTVVPAKYDHIECRKEGLLHDILVVRKAGKYGAFSLEGKPVLKLEFDLLKPGYLDFGVLAQQGNKAGVYSTAGELLVPLEYDSIVPGYTFNYPGAKVVGKTGDRYFLIAADGSRKVLPFGPVYQDDDVAPPMIFESMDDTGWQEPDLDELRERFGLDSIKTDIRFEPYYISCKGDRFGLVDKLYGQEIVPPEYEQISGACFCAFSLQCQNKGIQNLVFARKNGRFGIVDNQNRVFVPFEYDAIHQLEGGLIELVKKGKKGLLITTTTYPLIQPNYDELIPDSAFDVTSSWQFALFKVKKNGRWGYIGENGVEFFK